MTVDEYLKFMCDLKKVPQKERKEHIDMITEMVGISAVSGRLIGNLSKGYKQRVGLAQALVGDPPILILDEPTVGLDPNQIIGIRKLIKQLSKNHSIIVSSHILSEIQAVCDRVVIINKGDIRAIDTIENLERSVSASLTLHIKVKGDRTKAASVIEMTKGVKEITAIDDEGSSIYAFTVQLEGDFDTARDAIMAECIKNGVSILEIYADKPNLESVFIELINRPAKKSGLEELLEETPDESGGTEDESDENEEEKEEE